MNGTFIKNYLEALDAQESIVVRDEHLLGHVEGYRMVSLGDREQDGADRTGLTSAET